MGSVVKCPACNCRIQRTPTGNLQDGLQAHYKTVHPGLAVPRVTMPKPTPGAAK